jgi:hypothetical protein
VRRALRSARRFCAPVADAQVPQLAERRLAGLRLGTLGALALAPGAPG